MDHTTKGWLSNTSTPKHGPHRPWLIIRHGPHHTTPQRAVYQTWAHHDTSIPWHKHTMTGANHDTSTPWHGTPLRADYPIQAHHDMDYTTKDWLSDMSTLWHDHTIECLLSNMSTLQYELNPWGLNKKKQKKNTLTWTKPLIEYCLTCAHQDMDHTNKGWLSNTRTPRHGSHHQRMII